MYDWYRLDIVFLISVLFFNVIMRNIDNRCHPLHATQINRFI